MSASDERRPSPVSGVWSRILRHSLAGAMLLTSPALASSYRDAPQTVGIPVSEPGAGIKVIESCLKAAAAAHGLSPVVLVILLHVEGGRLGRVSGNTNATVDIGPMQVNEIWLPKIARHWRSNVPEAFIALRDNFCANVEGGAWILRQGIDEARGDFWGGVGYYHSHNPEYKASYLHKVLAQAIRLQALSHQATTVRPPSSVDIAAVR